MNSFLSKSLKFSEGRLQECSEEEEAVFLDKVGASPDERVVQLERALKAMTTHAKALATQVASSHILASTALDALDAILALNKTENA